jgi:hypothetical protein
MENIACNVHEEIALITEEINTLIDEVNEFLNQK